MNAYESFACDFFLTENDPDMTFADILDAVATRDESVTVWEQFEDTPPRDLVIQMRGMVIALENRFIVR
jgi:hypothetical protein